MSKTNKWRRYAFMRNFNYETHDKNKKIKSKISEKEWQKLVIETVKKSGHDKIWLIFHDKDVDDEGNKKGLHVHGVIIDDSPRHIDSAKKSVGVLNDPYNKNMNHIRSDSSAIRYLTHTSDKAMKEKKWRYGINELHLFIGGQEITDKEKIRQEYTNDIAGNELSEKTKNAEKLNSVTDDLLSEIISGNITRRMARQRLNDDFGSLGVSMYLKRNPMFNRAEKEAIQDLHNKMLKEGRNLITCFIYGGSRQGKSSFVKDFSEYIVEREHLSLEKDIYQAPGTNGKNLSSYDILSGYREQSISIFDDISPTVYGFDNFIKLFDPHNVPTIQSRYQNKMFFSEKAFILKSVSTVDDYFSNIYSPEISDYNDNVVNVKKQVMSRIQYAIHITNNRLILYRNLDDMGFDEKTYVKSFAYGKNVYKDQNKMTNLSKKIYELMYSLK